jgi:hypothetical protein
MDLAKACGCSPGAVAIRLWRAACQHSWPHLPDDRHPDHIGHRLGSRAGIITAEGRKQIISPHGP